MPREAVWLPPQYLIRLKVYASLAALFGALALLVAALAFFAGFIWPAAGTGSPTARVYAGSVDEFEVAQPVAFPEGKFWLVKREDGSFVALSWSDPRNGCSIPWREGRQFHFVDRTQRIGDGWFREPCHGSTYNAYGERVFGPSPGDMNQYPVEVVGDKVFVLASHEDLIPGKRRLP